MYLEQAEYLSMGGSIQASDAAKYARLEAKARHAVDQATHGRVRDEAPVRESVRMCVFELIEQMFAYEASAGLSGQEVASMSNDGVSVSYAVPSGSDASAAKFARTGATIRQWLLSETDASGTPLLYAGVDA